jgi:hypothetical protein
VNLEARRKKATHQENVIRGFSEPTKPSQIDLEGQDHCFNHFQQIELVETPALRQVTVLVQKRN